MNPRLMTQVLFATDFSDDAARAQEYAMYLATAWDATLQVLHVIEAPAWFNANAATLAIMEQARAEAAQRLDRVNDQMRRSGVTVTVRQVLGAPHEQISRVSREQGADLIVLGTQGRTNLLYGLLGSTAERVVKDAPCPVLAVPGTRPLAGKPIAPTPALPIRHIMVPVDFSSPALDAVEYAIQLAQSLGSNMTLLHVLETTSHDLECGLGNIEQERSKRDHWNKHLADLTELVASCGLSAGFEISGGLPSEAILAAALRHKVDLLVMGTHGRRGISDWRFGSVAEAVLRRATCPVWTVKTPKFEPGHRRVVPQTIEETEIKGAE